MDVQALARFSELYAPVRAGKQRAAKLVFKVLDGF